MPPSSDVPDLEKLPVAAAARQAIARWLSEPRYADDREELLQRVKRAAAGDDDACKELDDAFCTVLPIGTAGRRGAVGPGTNRINRAVMRETAQGLATAMRQEGLPTSVAIVFDTRRDSRTFAHVVARQLAALGLGVTVVDEPRPTPLLSHMVRARGCGAGVVISASHNPPGDNGIKVYGPDGAQVLGDRSTALMTAIERAGHESLEPLVALDHPSITLLSSAAEIASVDDPYLDFVRSTGVAKPSALADSGLKVVFTPLHGVGHTSVLPVLRGFGLEVQMVEAQAPDGGEFSTVEYANPEAEAALTLAREQAEATGADLVLANDPDADRIGALARDAQGTLHFIDGNRLAVIMLDHVLRESRPPRNGWVLTTEVTTPLVGKLARAAGVEAIDDLLTGFKHHAGMMAEQPDRTCVFATEEAHGYLRGDDVHDKDGAVAALLMAEAAAIAKSAGLTLFDRLDDVWRRLGYHRERTGNLFAYGMAGAEAIAQLMKAWRAEPPMSVGGWQVSRVIDRAKGQSTGSPTRDLPGNVLVFELAPLEGMGGKLVLRPSGTEPKAKIYALAWSLETGAVPTAETRQRVDGAIAALLEDAEVRARDILES
jgi:phosphoglucomutase/phosphomannomutase